MNRVGSRSEQGSQSPCLVRSAPRLHNAMAFVDKYLFVDLGPLRTYEASRLLPLHSLALPSLRAVALCCLHLHQGPRWR